MDNIMEITQKVEEIVKKTILKYKIANKKEKVLVALSGGKDSTLTTYLLKKFGYNISGLHINLGLGTYSDKCQKLIGNFCEENEIPLSLYDIRKEMGSRMCYIRAGVQSKVKVKNCLVCGVIKKSIMNKEARRLKVDKIATGHNLDDEAQTFLMNLFKGSPKLSANSGPITRNTPNKKFIPRIKPLFFVLEEDIRKYVKKKKLKIVPQPCPCGIDSYRIQIRTFLNTVPGKQKEKIIESFEELYDKIKNTKDNRVTYCESCGEPSRNKLCKKCSLLKN
jgi:tRNA-5-methyluridine54 2-sulfurtransferase